MDEPGFRLVTPLEREVPAADDRTTVTTILDPLDFYALNDRITSSSEFRRFDARIKDGGDWKTINPPEIVRKTVLSRKGRGLCARDWPRHRGPRADGSIADRPGYDPKSRLYLALDKSLSLKALKAKPTQEDAVEALALLEDLLEEFPFVAEVDRSVALSMLMTTLLRPSMSVAPFHLIRAHASSTGKTYLVDLASVIVTGRWAPAIDMNRAGDEVGKRPDAVLRNGQPIISLDNLEGDLGGPALCLFTERPLIEIRPLGRSEVIQIESRAACLGTDHNVKPTDDIVRRMLVADLDRAEERSELHAFSGDPMHAVAQDRSRYIAAIMTIARAYILAGRPKVEIAPLASYGDGTRIVRSPLVWLGKIDPVQCKEKVRKNDPTRVNLVQLLAMLDKHLEPNKPFKAFELAELAASDPAWRDLLMNIAGSGGKISTPHLGRWLGKHEGQIVDGRRIEKYGDDVVHRHQYELVTAKI